MSPREKLRAFMAEKPARKPRTPKVAPIPAKRDIMPGEEAAFMVFDAEGKSGQRWKFIGAARVRVLGKTDKGYDVEILQASGPIFVGRIYRGVARRNLYTHDRVEDRAFRAEIGRYSSGL